LLSLGLNTDFEALYAFKCGGYQRCLVLSTQNVRRVLGTEEISGVFAYPEFTQLMDDGFLSLIALMLIVNPSFRENRTPNVFVLQLYLSLYLMTQCQLKLRHSMTSLAQTSRHPTMLKSQFEILMTTSHLIIVRYLNTVYVLLGALK